MPNIVLVTADAKVVKDEIGHCYGDLVCGAVAANAGQDPIKDLKYQTFFLTQHFPILP